MHQLLRDATSCHQPTPIWVMAGRTKAAMCKELCSVFPCSAILWTGHEADGQVRDVGRTINSADTTDAKMTNEMCTQFCFGKGFPYAGTEYTSECYCGSSLATGGVQAPAADCGMTCGGNATQPCGGPGRLTLWKTSQVAGPSVNPGVNGWVSGGCYS